MNSERFAEAQFYLTTYGNMEMTVTFLMRHGFLVQACNTVLKHNLPPAVRAFAIYSLHSSCNELLFFSADIGTAFQIISIIIIFIIICILIHSAAVFGEDLPSMCRQRSVH